MEKARAVAYIRVSTERDAQLHSYEFQEHYWQSAFEDDPDTELIGIYADKGISGHSVQKRPKFLVMMQDAREHKFDKIYTKSVSRFARNTTQLLEAVRELRDLGIEVVFENENIHTFQPTSEIFLTIAATIAENDLEVDSARQRWSIQHRCENGWISVGSGLFGLKLTADNELEIVPEEAAVIRYIYESYVDGGIGSKRIADALNAAGVQSRNGYPWDAKHIIGLLRNEKYKGDALLQKKFTVDFLTKKKKVNEGEIPQYYVEGNHEAIISPEVFEMVQQEMERRSKRGRRSGVHLFSGKIRCGECGSWYGSKTWHSNDKYKKIIWQCNHKFDGDHKCTTPHLTNEDIHRYFISAVNQLLAQKDTIIASLTGGLALAFDLTPLQAQETALIEEVQMLADAVEKCIYENAHVALDQTEYQKRYDGLVHRYDEAKVKLGAITEQIADKKARRGTIEEFLKVLREQDGLVTDFQTNLWCGLVDFMTVYSADDVRITFKNGAEIKA